MVSRALNVGLRGWELFCGLIVMALIGNMIATAHGGSASIVNYDMFVTVFGMLSLFYLLPTAFLSEYSQPTVNIVLDTLNVIFWFCGAVATAAYLGVHSCNNGGYTHSNRVTNSSPDTEKRCREAQASTAFLWFGWAGFTASMVFSIMNRGNVNLRGGIRRPAMSQVSPA